MADLLAFCNRCGYSFKSGIGMGKNTTVVNCISRCPNCGNSVQLNAKSDENGNIHIFGKTAFRVLTSIGLPTTDLVKLKKLVKPESNNISSAQKNELIETIRHELPELEEVTNLLVPTNPGEFYSFLSFLLALITFIILMRNSSKEPQQTVINNFYHAPNPEAAAYQAAYDQSGIKRKDPCPCGSGKKFKNCHGS